MKTLHLDKNALSFISGKYKNNFTAKSVFSSIYFLWVNGLVYALKALLQD